ncbi:SH3 domain protein, partial [Aureobasidium melanogenum]
MFRAQANTFDEVVTKATDENLTSENWALILDVCDRVSTSPTGPQSVTAALIKRLAHRNANVQLYTLELANALSQNCGAPIHRELSSRSFTDALLRLAADRNTHQQVKSKILERMQEWKDMFKGNPDLGIMEQAYDKLRSSNPGLAPPSKPVKRQIEDTDRRKEEEELQMALALSLKDKAPEPEASSANSSQAQPDAQQGTTAATVSRVKALYDFVPSEPGELAFKKGDVIAVIESVYKDWWKGSLRGQTGIFPLNYVEKLQDPTREELERDAQTEADVFSQIRNVEKLLALLSVRGENSRDTGSEDEITDLYNQTLSIRPKLIELIGKYSQKKDEFTQLNEKFIKARRDYEALLESSMSQPQYPAPPARQHSGGYYNPYPTMQSGYPPQGPPPDQRFYNQPPPSEPPQQQNAYGYPPPMSNPSATPAPAPFHFLPNGAPPSEARQSPKPMGPGPSAPPGDGGYNPAMQPYNNRPQSIHTLNSGNPQELSTGAYESPTDGRNNVYGAGASVPAPLNYTSSPQPQQPTNAPPGPPQQQQMPIRQRTSSFESPTSVYSAQPPQDTSTTSYPSQYPPQQHPNQSYTSLSGAQPSAPPASGQAYQAYNPQNAHQQGQQPPQQQQYAPVAGGDDASDYYR